MQVRPFGHFTNFTASQKGMYRGDAASIERFYEDAQQLEKDLSAEWKALYNADLGFEFELEKSERLRFFADLELERFFLTLTSFLTFVLTF